MHNDWYFYLVILYYLFVNIVDYETCNILQLVYLCIQCLSPPTLRVRIPLRRGVLDTLCDKVCQSLVAGRWFSPSTPVSSTNKTDCHDVI